LWVKKPNPLTPFPCREGGTSSLSKAGEGEGQGGEVLGGRVFRDKCLG